ncbi:MAG: hypothetical protein KF830_02885 [Planctomycetes bacterium]|nr:hypothetical protein [Planctomycetota bacterium]
MAVSSRYSLSVGELVGKTFSIYLRKLPALLLLSAIVLAPWIVLLLSAREASTPSRGVAIAIALLQAVLGMVLTGAVTYGVVQDMLGRPTSLGQVIAIGMQSLLRVLGTGIVVGTVVGIGMLLLIVPGIILQVVLFVAIPVAVMEKKGVGDSMSRSAKLTEGSRWQVFGGAVLVFVVTAGMAVLGAFAFATTSEEEAPLWFEILTAVALGPLSATMGAVCYVLLRQGKEHVDVQQIAGVFD